MFDTKPLVFFLASIVFWTLFGNTSDTLSCDLKKSLNNIYIKHITIIVSIFLLFIVVGKEESSAFELWKTTFILYFLYFFLTKSKWYYSVLIIFFILIEQTLNIEINYLKNNKSNNRKNIDSTIPINKYIKYSEYIRIFILLLIVLGFVHYLIRQKLFFKSRFDFVKFLFSNKCNKKFSLN
jgi:hypothetical protein